MRYQQQQKGLFTFYKEQELFELKIQHLKQQQIQQKQQTQQTQIHKKQSSLNHSNSPLRPSQKLKIYRPTNTEDSQQIKSRNSKLKQIGSTVVVINHKNTESIDFVESAREIDYQEKVKPTGHFIQNKKVDFQELEKYKISYSLMHPRKRKKTYLKMREQSGENKYDQERRSTKLPTLVRVEQNDDEEDIQHHISVKSKPVVSSLKYQGGNLMRYIRGNMKSQCQTNQLLGRQSVSFIQYSKGYIKDSKNKKLDGLNDEQKRLLQVLCRYRHNQTN